MPVSSLQLSGIKIEYFTRRIMFSSVACPALPYFSTLSKKSKDFREKNSECKMYVLILSTTFV